MYKQKLCVMKKTINTYWNRYGPVSILQRAGECEPNLRNNILA